MCEIAVKKTDNDSGIDATVRWMAGDIVVVCCEGHPWTDKERANFDIIELPGVTELEAREFCVPESDDEVDAKGLIVSSTPVHRSRFKIDATKNCFTCKVTAEETVLEDYVVSKGGDPDLMQPEYRKPDDSPGKSNPKRP